ncbi:hypothetical protein FGG08_006056 [Glutinoglossum americanum]|uniref:Uncharacterized protein n=1 Tax=Glutinoglossum americanum TaxID=1670608 RepID=A0A9P8I861_9PEZI|nr:hypothetical protein FGG08_006056 [Glutinoglossum americanum]
MSSSIPSSCIVALLGVQRSAWRMLCLCLPCNQGITNQRTLLQKAISSLAKWQQAYTHTVKTIMCGAPSSLEAVDSTAIPMLARLVKQMNQVISLLCYQVELSQLLPVPASPPSGPVEDSEDSEEEAGQEEEE